MEKDGIPQKVLDLAELMPVFNSQLTGMAQVWRWEGFRRNYRQSTLHHTITLQLLAGYLLGLEQELAGPGKEINALNFLQYCGIHDFEETRIGDLREPFKKDCRMRHLIQVVSDEQARQVLSSFGIIADNLLCINQWFHSFKKDDVTMLYFDALERLEYLLYAVNEYIAGNTEFVSVFARQCKDLGKYAEKFPSIRQLLSREVFGWLDDQVLAHPDLAKAEATHPAQECHLQNMVDATWMVLKEALQNGLTPEKVLSMLEPLYSDLR